MAHTTSQFSKEAVAEIIVVLKEERFQMLLTSRPIFLVEVVKSMERITIRKHVHYVDRRVTGIPASENLSGMPHSKSLVLQSYFRAKSYYAILAWYSPPTPSIRVCRSRGFFG